MIITMCPPPLHLNNLSVLRFEDIADQCRVSTTYDDLLLFYSTTMTMTMMMMMTMLTMMMMTMMTNATYLLLMTIYCYLAPSIQAWWL